MTYGCFNRAPLKQTVRVQDGYIYRPNLYERVDRLITIPDPMTKHCNYTHTTLGQQDPKCFNCNWRQS